MHSMLDWLFPAGFMPHGHCYLWRPDVLWLHVGSDALIASSYFAIPTAVGLFVRRRRAVIPFWWIASLFAAFIFLCGSTHLLNIWTVWNPDYVIDGLVKLATAVVSAATAVAVFLVLPKALELRTSVQLQHEVDARTAELLTINTKLRDEIAARERTEHALRLADRRKDEFLATLAHELRNPLAPIRSAAHFLKLKEPADPALNSARDIIDRQVTHMARLVDDLLDVSRISRGRITLQRERVDLALAVSNAVETCRPSIESGQHRLRVTPLSQPLYVDGDLVRLSQVVTNLLSNAAKYTAEGGDIEISIDSEGTDARLRIKDSGVGIPPEMLEHVFEIFVQVDSSIERSHGGLGIGLTLARQLVQLHGGRIQARSEGRGLGSEFIVWLPLS